jgi:hypothetical protein
MTDRVTHGDSDADKMPYHCNQCGRKFEKPI